jgi:IclR family transcriptional regulator, pca regulon regulatory protein
VNTEAAPDLRREFVQGLERGFAVIKAFSADAPTLTIADVSTRTGLTRAVARRYLFTLKALGYVTQKAHGFSLTPRVLDLGFTYLASQGIAAPAQPYMEVVVEKLQEACSMATLDGRDIVYVARVPSKRLMTINFVVGSRLPAHCTSLGKVLLAALSSDALSAFFQVGPLEARTERTVHDPDALLKELKSVKAQGWAIADGESERGVRTAAVPIVGRDGHVQAALNVSGHASRVSRKELRSVYVPVLLEAADAISRMLGAPPERILHPYAAL